MGSAELDEFVERVAERTDIYSVVSRYVQLTQKSGRYWGRCPFHNEKTASFSVSADKGLFYCFGCGAGGNVFKFLSLIENITYFEAVKLQAQRLGIDLPAKKSSPEEDRRRREEKTLLKINEFAQDFYHECLIKTARGEVGRKYLTARGITAETIENFKIGYAPEEWENLLPKLTRQGFSPGQLETVGLIAKRKNSPGYYDRFRNRIMIPIADIFGHVVGFGGRVLGSEDDTTPKYLNTPETVLFNKRNLLFGLDKSNRAISTAGAAVVVEGYMDAISLFSAGIKNVVATLGTAFTPEHVKLILRYARKIIFCYDSDEAGQRATIRALPIVQAAGAEVFVITIPDGKDPDEFVRKHGKEEFDALIKNAEPLIDYRMNYVLARADLSMIRGKSQALQEIFPVIEKIDKTSTRNEYLKKIASAFFMDERDVVGAWKKFSSRPAQENTREPAKKFVAKAKTSDKNALRLSTACEDVLRMAWHESDTLGYTLTMVPREFFSEVHREIIAWLETCAEQERRPDKMSAAKELTEAANAELSRILMNGSDSPRNTEVNIFEDSVKILRRAMLNEKYYALLAQAEKYMQSDKATYAKKVEESFKIKKEIDKLQG
ncbi:MAG: DNA primase [Selenomonadaceae bacterium]|nr:DNA primase [Selenomonadaceae bacterium]